MASTFTWLDYSEHERRKMLDVIELFGEKTTRDELGLGGVRDAFADLLFPGTSTIQTAAKYFLFVPWIYQALETRRAPSSKVALRARRIEIELARRLEESGESDGVIGRIAGAKLQRLPSSIYWQGLAQWGIRTFPGSQDEYHRSLDRFYQRQRARQESRHEHDGETADEADLHNWDIGLPEAGGQFPVGATLSLSVEEAEYLRERVMTHCPRSLLGWLLRERVDVVDAAFAWELQCELPEVLRKQMRHGRNFSETVHGAQLLYNLMLAEKRNWQDRIDQYQTELSEWRQRLESRMSNLRAWNWDKFRQVVYQSNPRVSGRAYRFIQSWLGVVTASSNVSDVTDSRTARQLVEDREAQIKPVALVRLRSQRALERWEGRAGADQLDLRWKSARRIVTDILNPQEAEVHA